jgi:hypothetical protein
MYIWRKSYLLVKVRLGDAMVSYEAIDPTETISTVTLFLLLICTIFGFACHPIVGGLFLVAVLFGIAAYFHFSIFKVIIEWLTEFLSLAFDYWKD